MRDRMRMWNIFKYFLSALSQPNIVWEIAYNIGLPLPQRSNCPAVIHMRILAPHTATNLAFLWFKLLRYWYSEQQIDGTLQICCYLFIKEQKFVSMTDFQMLLTQSLFFLAKFAGFTCLNCIFGRATIFSFKAEKNQLI